MASQYDPALCERLVAEAREDDYLQSHSVWNATLTDGVVVWRMTPAMHDSIARTHNNLSAMADQLEAAKLRISSADAELDAANADLSTLRGLRESAQAEVDRLRGCSKSWANHAASITAERDALRAEVERLTDQTRGQEWQEDVSAVVVTLRREVDHWRDARNAAMAAGEILKAQCDELRAEVEKLRPVVSAAEYYVNAGGAVEVSDAACDLQAAVHDYRANEKP